MIFSQTTYTDIWTRAARYRERINQTRNQAGSPLLRRALRHYNAETYRSPLKGENFDVWLDAVVAYTRNEEMKDPDTSDEAPEDIWVGPTSSPRKEEVRAWKDGVSER
jgi:hypothetical protein